MTSETNKQTLDLRRSEALLFGRSSTTAEEKRKKTDSESQMDNFPVMGIGKVSRMRTYKISSRSGELTEVPWDQGYSRENVQLSRSTKSVSHPHPVYK